VKATMNPPFPSPSILNFPFIEKKIPLLDRFSSNYMDRSALMELLLKDKMGIVNLVCHHMHPMTTSSVSSNVQSRREVV